MPLRVLIIGAGVCGPALAVLLQGSDHRHHITVVERSSSLRVAGQQLDLKDHGMPIVRKMGLLDNVRSHCVAETGMELVDSNGKSVAAFGTNEPGKSGLNLTNEYEIMRGDLVNVFYEASLGQRSDLRHDLRNEGELTYEFGKTVTDLTQNNNVVHVTFSDGQKKEFDLVVAADGQGSRIRRLILGAEADAAAFQSVGINAAYYSIPRVEGEGTIAKCYNPPGSFVMTRNGNRPMTQVYFFTVNNTEKLNKSNKESITKQKEAWAETFKDAGWQCDRFVSALHTCEDFYAHEIVQIKTKQLYSGRVVLLGDAGYCPSPFTGQGTTASLIGAYVLAGELAKHGDDVDSALKAYEEIVRPRAEECQKLLPFVGMRAMFPSSDLGIWIFRKTMWAISVLASFKIDRLLPRARSEWNLPDYPELNLGA